MADDGLAYLVACLLYFDFDYEVKFSIDAQIYSNLIVTMIFDFVRDVLSLYVTDIWISQGLDFILIRISTTYHFFWLKSLMFAIYLEDKDSSKFSLLAVNNQINH